MCGMLHGAIIMSNECAIVKLSKHVTYVLSNKYFFSLFETIHNLLARVYERAISIWTSGLGWPV